MILEYVQLENFYSTGAYFQHNSVSIFKLCKKKFFFIKLFSSGILANYFLWSVFNNFASLFAKFHFQVQTVHQYCRISATGKFSFQQRCFHTNNVFLNFEKRILFFWTNFLSSGTLANYILFSVF